MSATNTRDARIGGTLRLVPLQLDLDALPTDLPWSLSYRPGAGYMVAIHHARGQVLDSGTHPTPQAALREALLFASVHRLFAGPEEQDPDLDWGGQEPAAPAAPDWAPALGFGLRLVLAALTVAALVWQFRA